MPLELHGCNIRHPRVVAFQGGEPTIIGQDFFRRTLVLEAAHAAPRQKILNTVQTNATLIDDEWGPSSPSTSSSAPRAIASIST